MPVPTIEWKNNRLRIIDQSLLPHKLKFIHCDSIEKVWRVIRKMKIRGAPALGIAAAYGMYLGIKNSNKKFLLKNVEKSIKYLSSARPTARNLFWALERMENVAFSNKGKSVNALKKLMLNEAHNIFEEDRKICRLIGLHGNKLIKNTDTILTHCNAGALATADYGTALAVLFTAHEKGKKIRVYVDETRPLLQGARLTAWELLSEKIDTTLICDNMAATLMAKGVIDKVLVGADRITLNGDVANKIGTYNLAILARYHRIPFYVAAPISTIDFNMKKGNDIPIEERNHDEVKKIKGVSIAPGRVKAFNPAFDVTPNRFVSAIITEKGILRKPFVRSIRAVRLS